MLKQLDIELWIGNIGNNKERILKCITKKSLEMKAKTVLANICLIMAIPFLKGILLEYLNKKEAELVFVEVKSRSNDNCGTPAESVTKFKQKHLTKCAEYYLYIHHLEDCFCRFDVIEVTELFKDKYKNNHIKNTF